MDSSRARLIRGHVAVLRALLCGRGRGGHAALEPGRRRCASRSTAPRAAAERREARGRSPETSCGGSWPSSQPEWRLFFEVLAQTGVRIGEAVELRAGRDLKLGARPRLEVRRQYVNGEVSADESRYGCRDIPLSPAIARRLWQLGRRDDELLFTTLGRDADQPAQPRRATCSSPPPCALACRGRPCTRSATRCASLLFAAGKNPKQVQEWLGHHDAAFTLRTYVHLLEEGVGDAAFFDVIVHPGAGAERPADAHDQMPRARASARRL